MKNDRVLTTIILILIFCSAAWGRGTSSAAPEEMGISPCRLTRIDDFVNRHIEAKHFAGAVTLVARLGKIVHYEAYGMQDIEAGIPMSKDSIFRIQRTPTTAACTS